MKAFEPIAIVGQGCILPGCTSPEALWETVIHNHVNITEANEGSWRINMQDVTVTGNDNDIRSKTWHTKGGYVLGFDKIFDPNVFHLDAGFVKRLDPLFQWGFYAAQQALNNAGYANNQGVLKKTGLILGNLSYPSRSLNALFEQLYIKKLFPGIAIPGKDMIDPVNRFMSGLPALLTAKAIGAKGDAFAIDAACASSLYALKIACDKLHERETDMMLVGGVCAADQLFLHVGFTALNALSKTGQSRPFNKGADGLIPAEGAAFIVIKRLSDVNASQDNVLGIIKGTGLSNDGRSGGFLSPSKDAQVLSMERAYEQAKIKPGNVGYVECHATGTSTGDLIEMESMIEIFGRKTGTVIGSLKANLGHSITTSGIAGIIKILQAFKHKTFPPAPNARPLNKLLKETSFRALDTSEKWNNKTARIAAVSNFGFGGNNAHVIIEEWINGKVYPKTKFRKNNTKIAITGIDIQTDRFNNATELLYYLKGNKPLPETKKTDITFDVKSLNFPPNDLKKTLGQQLFILNTVQNVLKSGINFDKSKTGVFIGMGVDTEISRYSFRSRIREICKANKISISDMDLAGIEENISPLLDAAQVTGTMPNIPANRINTQFDFKGAGFTVSCEELSGIKALEIAIQSIKNGELSTAIVGAVDMSYEYVHQVSVQKTLKKTGTMTDAAVVLVLKKYETAKKEGDEIYAVINDHQNNAETIPFRPQELLNKIGYAHAADGLMGVAISGLLVHNRLEVNENNDLVPLVKNKTGFSYKVNMNTSFGGGAQVKLTSEALKTPLNRTRDHLSIYCYTAPDKESLIHELQQGNCSYQGSHRLSIIASNDDIEDKRHEAIKRLSVINDFEGWMTGSIVYRHKKIEGGLAFAFTGAAAAYSGMGKDLLMEFPELVEMVYPFCKKPAFTADWIYKKGDERAALPFWQLAGSAFISQVHGIFSQHLLQLRPDAAIGLSSGETNAIIALGVWNDIDNLLSDIHKNNLFTHALAGRFDAVKKYWDNQDIHWNTWRILAPVVKVNEIISREEKVFMTIIYTENDCVISGEASACNRVIKKTGTEKAFPSNQNLAIHCPVVQEIEKEWRTIHTRESNTVHGIQFYSNYYGGIYETTRENVANALTGQATTTIDFPKIINKAWDNGIRIFIEHGPRSSLNAAIHEILQGKEFLCVSFDKFGQSSLLQALKASAELWCAGVGVNLDALLPSASLGEQKKNQMVFSLHKPPIKLTKRNLLYELDEANQEGFQKSPGVNAQTKDKDEAHRLLPEPPPFEKMFNKYPLLKNDYRNTEQFRVVENKTNNTYQPDNMTIGLQITTKNKPFHTKNKILDLLLSQHRITVEMNRHYLETQLTCQGNYMSAIQKLMGQLSGPGSIPKTTLPGPKFSRKELEILASGKISSVFGKLFEQQDKYDIQVRLPGPPMLLCDRVTGIKGGPGTLGPGTIWTETDVTENSWYLHNNRMPAGIFIEAGQADLLLISWLGIDFQNKGERAYRLLGCRLIFYGELPKPGETLKYEIHVDGYARTGNVTIFFFHYDCYINGQLRISVREGQAGFFTKKELQESQGVIWDPAEAVYSDTPIEELSHATKKKAFSQEEVLAYTQGNMVDCFGSELEWTKTHSRTPRSQDGYQNFIRKIIQFDLKGGPAKRGYLKAESQVTPDDWYFKGHFKNDECMPGTLMAEACIQMMSFYMVGAGLSIDKDGWRFEPVTNENYKFVCRGQVIPKWQKLIYEIFVDEIIHESKPALYAHVLVTADGIKAFLCERLGLRLVPDWPLSSMKDLTLYEDVSRKTASYKGFRYDSKSILNCALGNPANAFGTNFADDGTHITPRLPAPPYLFITRIAELKAVPGQFKNNPYIVAEYDIPENGWYFSENGTCSMPYSILMETALQPCGWLSTFVCQDMLKGKELVYRNLDGEAVQHREVLPTDKRIITKVILIRVSVMGNTIILNLDVQSTIASKPIYTLNTIFGFFDNESMKTQKGLPIEDEEMKNVSLPSNIKIDLLSRPPQYFSDYTACLPSSKLLMIDRIISFYPEKGKHKKGYIRAEKDIAVGNWFFKAHFYRDPVQPGSLGIEAIIQLIRFYMLNTGMHKPFDKPTFEPVLIQSETEWHYRGQVTPDKKKIIIDFDVKETVQNHHEAIVTGEARLWVDGLKIYNVPKIGLRVFEGENHKIVCNKK